MRRTLAVLIVLTACSAPAPPRSAAPSPTPPRPATLAAPTGEHPVGTTVLHLTDASRPDPWNLDAGARELRVTLWYPSGRGAGERAAYMSPRESELTLAGSGAAGVPPDILSRTVVYATTDAPAPGRHPLVVLSPGFTKPVSTLTSLAEDLASRGYVVAGVDHTYENYATTLADGAVAECLACDSDTDPGFGTGVVGNRAADVSFVLDELLKKKPAMIDPTRIAMAGQSIGGASALAAMAADPRIDAGINFDGTTYARLPRGFARPFLFVGTPQHAPGGRDHSWDRDWNLLKGWKRWLTVTGADHQSFTDLPQLQSALGLKPLAGTPGAARLAEITRTYVAAFLDEHLRSRPQPLWAGPSSRYPEVKFGS
ncbi:alpha/beta hydrolase [Herbidospora galbida]|uniref:Alpha/beta hydrolase n=1 Tax=Herbidospora galbida TaxID=2575442 RepID=A0A4U3MGR4_9ACTN|nr:alpha/beta hydrolase [Herbidospora galbida]TKK87147.1 alpha/beta hydrolase [Herbidospora galbida]